MLTLSVGDRGDLGMNVVFKNKTGERFLVYQNGDDGAFGWWTEDGRGFENESLYHVLTYLKEYFDVVV